ncbi:hypothetical protein [Shinella sp. WSJ-2]|uniref:hypothetical protein n=1 Tax=Shinella sp. WSJ-2 TaxID=2303749 RepID=UPI0011C13C2E|nr:hypothetical protein [Shinella sp. WSJ-2]
MAKAEPTKRLHALIDYLDTVQFRRCPTGVGLKTAIRARDLGLVEFDDDEADRWTYRLTDKGAEYRGALAASSSRSTGIVRLHGWQKTPS